MQGTSSTDIFQGSCGQNETHLTRNTGFVLGFNCFPNHNCRNTRRPRFVNQVLIVSSPRLCGQRPPTPRWRFISGGTHLVCVNTHNVSVEDTLTHLGTASDIQCQSAAAQCRLYQGEKSQFVTSSATCWTPLDGHWTSQTTLWLGVQWNTYLPLVQVFNDLVCIISFFLYFNSLLALYLLR